MQLLEGGNRSDNILKKYKLSANSYGVTCVCYENIGPCTGFTFCKLLSQTNLLKSSSK